MLHIYPVPELGLNRSVHIKALSTDQSAYIEDFRKLDSERVSKKTGKLLWLLPVNFM